MEHIATYKFHDGREARLVFTDSGLWLEYVSRWVIAGDVIDEHPTATPCASFESAANGLRDKCWPLKCENGMRYTGDRWNALEVAAWNREQNRERKRAARGEARAYKHFNHSTQNMEA